MNESTQKAIEKIKKCFALAKSDNPHEAAAAMRQAKALMYKHGVSANQVAMAEIAESTVGSVTMARDKPANWETRIAAMVGRAFGCQMLVTNVTYNSYHANQGGYLFIGIKHQAEVAGYTADVLIRKCKKARSEYVKNYNQNSLTGRRRGASRAGDMFAEGWATTISKLVHDFAQPPEVEKAIKEYTESKITSKDDTAKVRSLDKTKTTPNDACALKAGMTAAAGESLHRPMGANQAAAMIGFHEGATA